MSEIRSVNKIPNNVNTVVYIAPKIYRLEYIDSDMDYGKRILVKYSDDTITITCDGCKKYFKGLVQLIANKSTIKINKTPEKLVIKISDMDRDDWNILIKSMIKNSDLFM